MVVGWRPRIVAILEIVASRPMEGKCRRCRSLRATIPLWILRICCEAFIVLSNIHRSRLIHLSSITLLPMITPGPIGWVHHSLLLLSAGWPRVFSKKRKLPQYLVVYVIMFFARPVEVRHGID